MMTDEYNATGGKKKKKKKKKTKVNDEYGNEVDEQELLL
jgi:hypothetical protein